MHPRFPDWMFAAFAIGAWELAEVLVRKWHWMWPRTGAFVVIGMCLLVLVIRYTLRFERRLRHTEKPDPDAWKQY